MSSDSRDSAIQIFDKFMSVMLTENKESESDTNFISYAVAVSVVLSSKLHESRRQLSLLSFQDFRIDMLKHFERLILSKIGLSIAPQITPSSFVLELLFLWQPDTDHTTMIKIADSLISEFWEG
jgi:hypothetical protein